MNTRPLNAQESKKLSATLNQAGCNSVLPICDGNGPEKSILDALTEPSEEDVS